MFDMNNLMGKMQEMQAKMKEAQENLVNITTTAEMGGGMVKATVNGKREVVSLDIDDTILAKEEKEMVQDLTIAAINRALQDIEPKIKEEMAKSTAGFMPNIPGFDISKMF